MVRAKSVSLTEDDLKIYLSDGRTISVPLNWYPRLLHGTPEERANWRLIGKGEGIHWPDLDEDISVENRIYGQPYGESQKSFQEWQDSRPHRSRIRLARCGRRPWRRPASYPAGR